MVYLRQLTGALLDISQRNTDTFGGSKRLWTMIVLINFIGPIAYFLFGRKRGE